MNKFKKLAIGVALALGVVGIWRAADATITSTTVKSSSSLGNGVTTNYTIGFTFQANSVIRVYLQSESTTPYVRTAINYGAGAGKYTITGGDPGTTVVMGTAPTSTQRVIIERHTAITQTVDYDENSAFPADDTESQMDKMVEIEQEHDYQISQKIGLSTGSTATLPYFPDPYADQFVVYNHAATALTIAPSTAPADGDMLRYGTLNNAWSTYNIDTQAALANWNAKSIQGKLVNPASIADGKALAYESASGTIVYTTIPGTTGTANYVAAYNSSGTYTPEAQVTTTQGGLGIDASASTGAAVYSSGVANIRSLANADISSTAAISRSKLAVSTGTNQAVYNDGSGYLISAATLAGSMGGTGMQTNSSSTGTVKIQSGGWSVASIVDADISATAVIARAKIQLGTANQVVINSGTGALSGVTPGTAGNVLTSSAGAWISTSPSAVALSTVTKSATYIIGTTDDVIIMSAASTATLTLPDATTAPIKPYRVIRTDATPTANITFTTLSGQTANGYATGVLSLDSQWEAFDFIPNGTNWFVTNHKTITPDAAITFLYNGLGTVSSNSGWFKRVGDRMFARGFVTAGTLSATILSIQLPTGYEIDKTKFSNSSHRVGIMTDIPTGSLATLYGTEPEFDLFYDGAGQTTGLIFAADRASSNTYEKRAGNAAATNGDSFSFEFNIPIKGWQE